MEAQKLRFVRCPGCLQLLVEYPSIPVYQCGGCGTVLRAKNRVAPVVNTDTESDEHSKLLDGSTRDPPDNKSIYTEEQIIALSPSSDVQPSEVQENISLTIKDASPCENINEESSMSAGNNIDSGESVNMENHSVVHGNVSNVDARIEDMGDEGNVAHSCLDLKAKVENTGANENANSEKDSIVDDGSISNDVAETRSMVHLDLEAGSNNNSTGEIESIADVKSSCSNNNINCQQIVEGCEPDDETEAKSNDVSVQRDGISQPYEGLHAESHEELIEELVRSLSLTDDEEDFVDIDDNSELNDALRSQMGSSRFSTGNKMNDSPRNDPHGRLIEELEMSFSDAEGPLDQSVVVAHNAIAERVDVYEDGKEIHSLDVEGANSYEETVLPLDDGHLKSGQSVQQHELAAVSTEDKEEGHLEEIKTANHFEEDSETVSVISKNSSGRFNSTLPRSFDEQKEEKSYRYRARGLRQGLSLDSEDLGSIQNFIQSQMDGTSSSISSGSPSHGDLEHKPSNKFKKIDRLERLKKMDELRDQLNRLSIHKDLGTRYQNKCLELLQQQSSYKNMECNPRGYDADSIVSSDAIDPYYDHGKPPRYPPPVPFSPPHSYTHSNFGQRQPRMPYNCSAWEYNSYYQSSYAGSTVLEHESLSSSYKEQKRAVRRKHILRSLSGASPFTVCNGCFNLVQVPSDIYISKTKIAKIQCGQCSKVVVLSFPAKHNEDAKISKEVTKKPNKPGHNIVANVKDDDSFSAEHPRGNPVSRSEDCGASFSKSFSRRTRPAVKASGSGQKISDSALHLLMGYDSASQLLRHSRAFEDGYDSFESMVPVSNRVSRRKNS